MTSLIGVIDERGAANGLPRLRGRGCRRVVGENPGDIFRFRELGRGQHGQLEEIDEAGALFGCGFLGMRGQPPESFLIRGKAVRGKFDGRAFGIAEQLAN